MGRRAQAMLAGAAIVLTIVLINSQSGRFGGRADLTDEKLYTLSHTSRQIIANLPDRLAIKLFLSHDLPGSVEPIGRYLRELLFEYAAVAPEKVAVTVLDPGRDRELARSARRLGVAPIRLGNVSRTKRTVQWAYIGVAFEYRDRKLALPLVSSIENLEYRITSAIRGLLRRQQPTIAFSTGHGEPTIDRGITRVAAALEGMTLTTVDLSSKSPLIPPEVDVLIVAGPVQPMSEPARRTLDAFLMRGKALAVFVDGLVLKPTRRSKKRSGRLAREAVLNPVGLRAQLSGYGVALHQDLILDGQNRPIPVIDALGNAVYAPHPAYPLVTDFSRDSALTRWIKQLLLVLPSSVELTGAADRDQELHSLVLARSSIHSWRHREPFELDPAQLPQPKPPHGPFALAVYLKGSFRSFFAPGRDPRSAESSAADPTRDEGPAPTIAPPPRSPPNAQLFVMGDSEFMHDRYVRLSPANLLFLHNVVDYLAQDEALLEIRARRQVFRPLRHVEEATAQLIILANAVGLPLLFVLAGLAVRAMQRASRRRRAEALRSTQPRWTWTSAAPAEQVPVDETAEPAGELAAKDRSSRDDLDVGSALLSGASAEEKGEAAGSPAAAGPASEEPADEPPTDEK